MLSRKIVYLITVLIILSINIMYIEYAPFIVLLVMIILPIILYVYIFVVSKLIYIKINIKDQAAVRGDNIGFEIVVDNMSMLPAPNVIVIVEFKYNNCKDSMYKEFVINAKSFDKTKVSGKMLLNYCGDLTVRIKKTYTYDVLKIFSHPIRYDNFNQIIVMPKLNTPDYYTLHTPDNSILDSQHYSKKTAGNDSSEMFDIREYRDGDSINRIHWKLSAKEDKLFVKEFSMPINKSNVILVEMLDCDTQDQRKNLDGIYEMAYAIGNFAVMKERVFKLAFYSEHIRGLKIIEIESKDMLIEAIRILIQEGTYPEKLHALREFQKGELSDAQRIYYITSGINNEMIEFLDKTKDADFFIYCMEDGTQESDFLEIEGAMLFKVDRNDIKKSLNTILI